ncbi:MAG: HigA family addiction module antidote protein [Bacteroidales bacterium]|jgi:addiction module HigA family antidote|nr:HigA family addiction module antidote protein [Bacteroidales bacterium]
MTQKSFIPTHPGEVIKDELIARGISQKEFAQRIGVPYTMFNDILNERRPLSATTALFVESALGISADLLMGLQADYTMQTMRNDAELQRRLRKISPYSAPAELPASRI